MITAGYAPYRTETQSRTTEAGRSETQTVPSDAHQLGRIPNFRLGDYQIGEEAIVE